MSRILVTGGTGFVGHHLVRRICLDGLPVRVLARATSPLDALKSLPVEIVTGDLTDRRSLDRAVAGCDTVFHVAADYRLWVRRPQELYDANVRGTENMLGAASDAGVRRFVYTSTVGTVGFPADGRLGTEEDFPHFDKLSGHYKKSKFLAERKAFEFARKGFPVVIVNPTAPIGEGDRKPTDTGKIILDFLNRKMPAYIDTGLNLVDVHDVAEGHWQAMLRGTPGERYLLGGRNMSLKEILDELSTLTGLPAPGLRLPYAVAYCAGVADTALAGFTGRPPRVPLEGVKMARHKMYVSCAKAERDLGYRAGPVEEALKRAVEWFRDNGFVRRSAA